MTSPNDLLARSVVLDASVLINLVVVDDPLAVLRALAEPVVVTEAAGEVRRNPRTGARGDAVLDPLFTGPLSLIEMTEDETNLFVELVGAPSPDDLDDGEAATLACATRRGLLPLVDERKAHRIVGERLDGTGAVSTVGLYRHLCDQGAFPQTYIASCVFDSLRFARMRVAPSELDWVVSMLSPDQMRGCPSLPRRVREP